MDVDKSRKLGAGPSRPARGTEIKHIVANRINKLVDSRQGVGVAEIEQTVIEDTAVLVDPSLLTNQRTRGQDVIDPYQASRSARLGNQARWRVITSDSGW
jgi:hypothetical protein